MSDVPTRVKVMLRGGVTAAQVAEALDVSKPTAYKWIKALRKQYGTAIEVRRERVSARGPKSKVYTIRRTK